MNLLYPTIRLADVPLMLALTVAGALAAGCYGAVHDQVTYSICNEYFTRVKFQQFRYADCGLPPRVFVAQIGFLATWWVGLIGGWLVARVTVPHHPRPTAVRRTVVSYLIVGAFAAAAGLLGLSWGYLQQTPEALSHWRPISAAHGIERIDRFILVAHIHNAGYVGALLGLLAAITWAKWTNCRALGATLLAAGRGKY